MPELAPSEQLSVRHYLVEDPNEVVLDFINEWASGVRQSSSDAAVVSDHANRVLVANGDRTLMALIIDREEGGATVEVYYDFVDAFDPEADPEIVSSFDSVEEAYRSAFEQVGCPVSAPGSAPGP